MRWIRGRGLRTCWGCDFGDGGVTAGWIYDTQVLSSWMCVISGKTLVGEAYGGRFQSHDLTVMSNSLPPS